MATLQNSNTKGQYIRIQRFNINAITPEPKVGNNGPNDSWSYVDVRLILVSKIVEISS